MKKRYILIVLLTILAVGAFCFFFPFKRDFFKTNKEEFLHYDFVEFQYTPSSFYHSFKDKDKQFYVEVYHHNQLVTTVGKRNFLHLKKKPAQKSWKGLWPIPWNAAEGIYLAKLFEFGETVPLSSLEFKITCRQLINLDKKLSVVTWESTQPLINKSIILPNGSRGSWNGIFEWVKYVGANTFWYLCGQTSAYTTKPSEDNPWIETSLKTYPLLAKEAQKQGIDFGGWVACFVNFGKPELRNHYVFAYDYNLRNDTLQQDKGISIRDEKRIQDIIKLVRKIQQNPDVDYIGLDYIRPMGGAYELVEEFVEEMDIAVPLEWDNFSLKQKIAWLAKIVKKREKENMEIIDQWNWWRARQSALIVKRIKEEVPVVKPLWVFMLSWEKGWQHGQDAVMFNDAGADIIAVMLYECNEEQFATLIKDWNNYLTKEDAYIIVGNQFDDPLHQNKGPEEWYYRITTGLTNIYKDGIARGLFLHDLSRALWGRKGPYSTDEWISSGAKAIDFLNTVEEKHYE